MVVDNDSTDDSVDRIINWAKERGRISNSFPEKNGSIIESQSTNKSVAINYIDQRCSKNNFVDTDTEYSITLIKAANNNGFASGNNIAINYAIENYSFDYIWLLNPDTVIVKDTLSQLLKKAQAYKVQGRKVGVVGSKIYYYNQPEIIQSVGGRYNKYLSTTRQVGQGEKDTKQYDKEFIDSRLDYVSGASMLVSEQYINDVGLMSEDYFLYYEEIDWSLRGKKKGWELGYAWESNVYHKEGKSTGSNVDVIFRSEVADYYSIRNRVVVTYKFYTLYLPLVLISLVGVVISRVKRGQTSRVITYFTKAIKEMFEFLIDKYGVFDSSGNRKNRK